jgi:4-hydroxybenzoate polyprenyltransferase
MVTFCICFITFYTMLNIYLNYLAQIELNPTLTTCVYSFFGTELGLCAFNSFLDVIKDKNKRQTKKKQVNDIPTIEDTQEEEYI